MKKATCKYVCLCIYVVHMIFFCKISFTALFLNLDHKQRYHLYNTYIFVFGGFQSESVKTSIYMYTVNKIM